MPNKIDSNIVGLTYAEEVVGTVGTLPGSPVWNPLEPNSYGEFGPSYKMTARETINASRQKRKGTITDLDATGGFQVDFTQKSLQDLMQGFLFADWRFKTKLADTAVSSTQYTVAAGGTGFLTNSLLFGSDHNQPANNGLKLVTASAATTVTAAGLVAEASPPAIARITRVGHQGASGDITVAVSAGVATIGSTTLNFTTLGLIPGEWLWIGGDAAITQFATAANNGFARIKTIAANAIVLDRQPNTMVTDTGSGKTIQLFFGHVIKNEGDPALIKMRSYHLERFYGAATGYEYVKGAVPNTLEINVKQADKVTMDMGFIGIGAEDAAVAKTGTRPTLPKEDVYNSSSDYARLRMIREDTQATMFTYLTDLKVTIDNGMEPAKSIAVLGGFDMNAGDFGINVTTTAYFASFAALAAVQANADMSLDFAVVKLLSGNQVGMLFDIPLLSLGDGRRKVERNKPVMMDLTGGGAAHATLNHTLLISNFDYLPLVA